MKLKKIVIILLVFCTTFIFNMFKTYADVLQDCDSLIKYGDYNSCVSELQTILNEYGNCNLIVDGIFGEKTHKCVEKFQENNNLIVDGIVGYKTKYILNSYVEKKQNIYNKKIVITASKLYIRKKASTKAYIIDELKKGNIITILDEFKNGNSKWYRINYENKIGYINSDYTSSNFIVIDINNQNLELYKNKTLFLTTPIVSGTYNKYDTPKGYYKINYKQTNTYLRGRNEDGSSYKSYVNYWMPFNKGIGLHDASWRGNGYNLSYFGNNIYKTNGSHGCINMPYESTKKVYNNIRPGTIVVVK